MRIIEKLYALFGVIFGELKRNRTLCMILLCRVLFFTTYVILRFV